MANLNLDDDFIPILNFFHFLPKWKGRKKESISSIMEKKTFFTVDITIHGRSTPTLHCTLWYEYFQNWKLFTQLVLIKLGMVVDWQLILENQLVLHKIWGAFNQLISESLEATLVKKYRWKRQYLWLIVYQQGYETWVFLGCV